MYDVISDVHNCYDEMMELVLKKLGYEMQTVTGSRGDVRIGFVHPEGRKLVFAGDHVDRGPQPFQTLATMMMMEEDGHIFVQGGHDEGLREYIEEKPDWDHTKKKPHRHATIQGLKDCSALWLQRITAFIRRMPPYFETDDLLVVHASYRPELEGEDFVRACLHGSVTGWSTAEDWKHKYMGTKTIVHGHRNMKDVKILERPQGARIIGIDTGCSYGNKLTCYRHPEGEIVQVKARAEHYAIPPHYWWP